MSSHIAFLFWFAVTFVVLGVAFALCGVFDARHRTWPAGTLRKVEAITAVFGITGALLLAIPGVHPAWGFAAFLASNLAGIPFNKHQGHRWISIQQRCYFVLSAFGLWNWWLGPLVLG